MRLFGFVYLGLIGAVSLAGAEEKSMQLAPSADSYVIGGKSSTKNYGGDHTFLVRHAANGVYNRIGYVQFPISEIEDGQKVASATLTLRLASVYRGRDTSSTLQVYGLNSGDDADPAVIGNDWEEDKLIDDNAPVSSKMVESISVEAVTPVGGFTVPAVSQAVAGQEFVVSGNAVSDYIQTVRREGGKFVTFLIVEKDVTTNSVAFIAKENPSFQASTLEITLQ